MPHISYTETESSLHLFIQPLRKQLSTEEMNLKITLSLHLVPPFTHLIDIMGYRIKEIMKKYKYFKLKMRAIICDFITCDFQLYFNYTEFIMLLFFLKNHLRCILASCL